MFAALIDAFVAGPQALAGGGPALQELLQRSGDALVLERVRGGSGGGGLQQR